MQTSKEIKPAQIISKQEFTNNSTRNIIINMSTCNHPNQQLKDKQTQMIELLQIQNKRLKTQLSNTLQETEAKQQAINQTVEELDKQKAENARLIKICQELQSNLCHQKQVTTKFVGFTAIDPKHRIVLQQKEKEIVLLEQQLSNFEISTNQDEQAHLYEQLMCEILQLKDNQNITSRQIEQFHSQTKSNN